MSVNTWIITYAEVPYFIPPKKKLFITQEIFLLLKIISPCLPMDGTSSQRTSWAFLRESTTQFFAHAATNRKTSRVKIAQISS